MTGPETAELEAVDAALAGRPVAPEHAEIAEIALLLRDDRPQPTLAWGTQLDRRVEQGFPKRRRRRPSFGWIRPLAPAAGVLAALAIIVMVAVNAEPGGDDEAASGGAGSGAMTATEEQASSAADDAVESTGRDFAPVPPSQDGDPRSDNRTNRKVERSASLTVAAASGEIDRVADGVGRVASSLGGFVSSSSISSGSGGLLELRVPSERLDDAIARISRLGDVRRLQREARDITASVVSARSRLNDARAERTSLLRQLEDADTVNETESIRARLRIVSREIADARSSLRSRTNRAQYANVSVEVTASRATADEGGAWTPGDAAGDAVRVLEVIAGVLVIVAAILGPVALLALLAWGGHRALTRRRRQRALDMA